MVFPKNLNHAGVKNLEMLYKMTLYGLTQEKNMINAAGLEGSRGFALFSLQNECVSNVKKMSKMIERIPFKECV